MVDDTPDDLVFELHNEALWGAHPYGYSILGTRDTVSSLSVRDLRDLHERAYHPDHIVVSVSGNVDHDHLLDTLEQTGWADVPRGDTPVSPTQAPVSRPAQTLHVERDTTQTHLVFGAPAVSHGDPRRYAMSLVSMLLGGGMSSRLFQRVREELGLAYSVYTFQSFYPDTGVHGVYVATSPETAGKAGDAIREELKRLVDEGLPDDEIALGKSQLKGQVTLSLEGVTSRMYRAAGVALYNEPYRTLDEILAAIDAITAEQVAAVCAEFFAPERQAVVSLGPAAD